MFKVLIYLLLTKYNDDEHVKCNIKYIINISIIVYRFYYIRLHYKCLIVSRVICAIAIGIICV